MSKIDEVRSAMVAAMKARDKDRKDSLSALLSALKNKAIDKRADLTGEPGHLKRDQAAPGDAGTAPAGSYRHYRRVQEPHRRAPGVRSSHDGRGRDPRRCR